MLEDGSLLKNTCSSLQKLYKRKPRAIFARFFNSLLGDFLIHLRWPSSMSFVRFVSDKVLKRASVILFHKERHERQW